MHNVEDQRQEFILLPTAVTLVNHTHIYVFLPPRVGVAVRDDPCDQLPVVLVRR
jgi:hypothetical protein